MEIAVPCRENCGFMWMKLKFHQVENYGSMRMKLKFQPYETS